MHRCGRDRRMRSLDSDSMGGLQGSSRQRFWKKQTKIDSKPLVPCASSYLFNSKMQG